jgi:hypothetical protein
MVRHIRQSDQKVEELWVWLRGLGVRLELATIQRVRQRKRKAGVPD